MNILLMANTTNPKFPAVLRYLGSRTHHVTVTDDHRGMNVSKFDIGIAWYYRVVVTQEYLDQFKYGVINNHPGKLPEVRGAYTNIWPISVGAPCGVSIQKMDAGLDTGPLIADRLISVLPTDTGESLWHRLVESQFELFCDTWPMIESGLLSGNLKTYPQYGQPQVWKTSMVIPNDNLSDLMAWGSCDADEVVDYLRARTHSQYPGAYIIRDGRKIGVRVELEDLGPA